MAETIHDALPHEHYVETRHTYSARCSCGWVGWPTQVKSVADDDIKVHQETHARKAERA